MYNTIKRLIDVLVSITGLIVLLPLFIIISIAILLTSQGPVFFIQERIGRNLNSFKIYKFRTMTHEKHQVKSVIGKADGVTWIGYYLRRFKMDELPQLINVLKGEMSLVGPRPGIPEDLGRMSDEAKMRYCIRPGLTGLAQVSGNIYNSWEKRYEYDLEYIKKKTFFNDLKIIARTISIVIIGEEKFVDRPLYLKK